MIHHADDFDLFLLRNNIPPLMRTALRVERTPNETLALMPFNTVYIPWPVFPTFGDLLDSGALKALLELVDMNNPETSFVSFYLIKSWQHGGWPNAYLVPLVSEINVALSPSAESMTVFRLEPQSRPEEWVKGVLDRLNALRVRDKPPAFFSLFVHTIYTKETEQPVLRMLPSISAIGNFLTDNRRLDVISKSTLDAFAYQTATDRQLFTVRRAPPPRIHRSRRTPATHEETANNAYSRTIGLSADIQKRIYEFAAGHEFLTAAEARAVLSGLCKSPGDYGKSVLVHLYTLFGLNVLYGPVAEKRKSDLCEHMRAAAHLFSRIKPDISDFSVPPQIEAIPRPLLRYPEQWINP
jgi:hypothetical protein